MTIRQSDPPFSVPHDFKVLAEDFPELQPFLNYNKQGRLSINFYDSDAVKVFNRVLLKKYYQVQYWDFPDQFLCPPVPGRADYLYAVQQLPDFPTTTPVRCLDIGVGANCIYPLIGHQAYGWQFTGSDISEAAVSSAQNIVVRNGLESGISIRHQSNPQQLFSGILERDDWFDITVCNPPYFASEGEAIAAARRRLKHKDTQQTESRFSGVADELWCTGGELSFISKLIEESVLFGDQCGWFTVLVSKGGNLEQIQRLLETVQAEARVIPLQRGNKIRRVIAWKFNANA